MAPHATRAAAPTRIRVVPSLCIGSGLCTQIAPHVFTFDDRGKARAGHVDAADLVKARDAALACPARAIRMRAAASGPEAGHGA